MADGFTRVTPRVDFPALERRILDLWDDLDAFQTSIDIRPPERSYTFYDGPPFPTGSPHYGNLLAGVIKDVVPRYWTMQGYRIERRFGWDTHGLPIEMEVEKELGISGPRAIADFGIDKFNEACRARVQANTETWEEITRRIGRWIDFENDYRTLDVEFMESVWWAFRQLWDKGLIYKDFKVLPYSYGATTPLSNFEANMDYRDVDDPSITVRLRVTTDNGPVRAGDSLLIWTTTPWTLPANLAVAAGEGVAYARVTDDLDGTAGPFWLAADLVGAYWPDAPPSISDTVAGSELLGTEYEPPFDYFGEERDRGAFRVIASPEVTTTEGTGLVHMAPAYGEADFYALQNAGLDVLVDPIDLEARFTEAVPDVAGQNVKDADATLIRLLKEKGAIVRHTQVRHSYPFCWRTGTPLIYKAIPTWFVAVESFRDRMVELNQTIHWVPEAIGTRRFGNWLADARDWAISRNRYWGSCIPVWECDQCDESVCVGSIEELKELSGVELTDLHRHFVDPVTFPCRECDGTMQRVPEVLDCWFESGSMPYSENHYPFENAETFERRFPADFIAEGLDQTRGWFYTLVVLATALFDEVPFRNGVVNGLILAEDGRKMSKSLKNYPDPNDIFETEGADALRAYLLNSPLLRGEPLRFSESGVREVVRTVMLPYWNAFSFFTTYAEADAITLDDLHAAPAPAERAEIDRWILSMLQSLIRTVNEQMEGYYLYNVIPPMIDFIDDLTNWYIRRSRRRFWRQRDSDDDTDKLAAFATLHEVLVTFGKVIAPVLPFVTEEIYQQLVVAHRSGTGPTSIHHEDYPESRARLIDTSLEETMAAVRSAVGLGRSLRVANNLRIRQPLRTLTVVSRDPGMLAALESHADLIAEELNVKQVLSSSDETSLVTLHGKANFKSLGPRFGKDVKAVAAEIEDLSSDDLHRLLDGASIELSQGVITADDVVVTRRAQEGVVVDAEGPLSVALDCTLTPDLISEGVAREIVNRVQNERREQGLNVTDRIRLTWHSPSEVVARAFAGFGDYIAGEVLAVGLEQADTPQSSDVSIGDDTLTVSLAVAEAG
ncbi:MAG: isoleucine--tRNA ligase [Acidimicrobiia bacterium]|nr:isoleucine--tRNA ligase [Acidimicrobiia bacterium]